MPIRKTTPTHWSELRPDMTCREAIRARMAEDVADLIHAAGEFGSAGILDIIRLGWTEQQAWSHGPDLFRRAVAAKKRERSTTRPSLRRVA